MKEQGFSVTAYAGLSRRRMLALGAAGLGGLATTMSLPRSARAAAATPAPDLGISPSNSAAANRRNLVKALSYSATSITFPPGDYLIDNSKAGNPPARPGDKAVVIDAYSGTFAMQPGARLVFTDPSQGGLYFQYQGAAKKTGATLTNVTVTYAKLPSVRTSTGAITFEDAVDPVVRNITVTGSTAGGLVFWGCVRPVVEIAHIKDTMADGVHFGTCKDGRANKVYTDNTGDDGLAFVNYGDPSMTGGTATNIEVVRSKARGITVVGQSGVTIDHFGVNWSRAAGILCGYDAKYHTEVPTDVTFKNGFVYNGGALPGGHPGNDYGISWNSVGEIHFRNINVRTPGSRGVTGTAKAFTQRRKDGSTVARPAGTVHLDDITVTNAPSTGFNLQGGTYRLNALTARDTGDVGMFVADTQLLAYGTLTSTRTSKTASLHRAFNFERNRRIEGGQLRIEDDRATPTGYVAGFYGSQSGNLGTIHDKVTNRDIAVENPSKLTYKTG